jgi:hypothetical protein
VRATSLLAAVLIAAGAVVLVGPDAGIAKRRPPPPTAVWYRFVVVGETVQSTIRERHLPNQPAESSRVDRTIKWAAESRTATTVTRSGADILVTAGMRGAVLGYRQTTSYEGFYSTPDPTNVVNLLQKPCQISSSGDQVHTNPSQFGGILVGSALTGFALRVDALPLVTVRSVRSDGCSDNPGPSQETVGTFSVSVVPRIAEQRQDIRFARAAIRFGATFSARFRFRDGQAAHPAGDGWTETDTSFFKLRVVLFRCPGTRPCTDDAVPDSAFNP